MPLLYFLCGERARTHLYGTVQWTIPAASANTGGYIYSLFLLREKRMQVESGHLFTFSFEVRYEHPRQKHPDPNVGRDVFRTVTGSNPFIWDSPVDCPCHQHKYWWLPIFSSHAEWEENASRVRSPFYTIAFDVPYPSITSRSIMTAKPSTIPMVAE